MATKAENFIVGSNAETERLMQLFHRHAVLGDQIKKAELEQEQITAELKHCLDIVYPNNPTPDMAGYRLTIGPNNILKYAKADTADYKKFCEIHGLVAAAKAECPKKGSICYKVESHRRS